MPGASIGVMNVGEMLGKALRPGPHQDAQGHRQGLLQAPARRGGRQAARPGAGRAGGDPRGGERRHRLPRRDRQDRARGATSRGGRSREGVQRDLLPLVEGTTVATKYGPVKTDHILFIASGAFHVSKPSDLLPELQGRLPIRVELRALTEEDFRRILTETEASLIKQYKALMATEGVTLDFTDDAINAIARIAVEVNSLGREHRRAAAADGDGAHPRRDLLHRHRPRRRDDRPSTRPTSRRMSAISRGTPISAGSSCEPARTAASECEPRSGRTVERSLRHGAFASAETIFFIHVPKAGRHQHQAMQRSSRRCRRTAALIDDGSRRSCDAPTAASR